METKETPWAVHCPSHGKICLSKEEYDHQNRGGLNWRVIEAHHGSWLAGRESS